MSRVYLSAAHKSSGKTLLAIGLSRALADRGRVVQTFKKGPDYIDPLWLSLASGRPCFNLDFNTQTAADLRASFSHCAAGTTDIALIEGNKGLHDGVAADGHDANAALAKLLAAPVVLVIDTVGMTRGIAALVQGVSSFDPDVQIGGVILNKTGGERHEAKLRNALQTYTDIPVIGAVRRDTALSIDERHLGLIPANESALSLQQIERLATVVADSVNLDQFESIANSAPALSDPGVPTAVQPPRLADTPVRIGVPRDAAFGFYYPDDLQTFEEAGAEMVFFDSLADARMPAVDGLFIGGGFPETQMQALQNNRGMRESIREFGERGGPIYAECGGLMYLGRRLHWQTQEAEMVGLLPVDIEMDSRPHGRGLVVLEETAAMPWAPGWGSEPEFRAHEFHYSRLRNAAPGLQYAYRVKRGQGIDGQHDGIVYNNVLACYAHQRSIGSSRWVQRFVHFVRDRARR